MDCTWVTARTQCSESDGALYDAHIRAVKLQAKTAGKAEVDLFHNLCWGYGKVALGRYPPELDGADAANRRCDSSLAGPAARARHS